MRHLICLSLLQKSMFISMNTFFELVCANGVQDARTGVTAAEEHIRKSCPALSLIANLEQLTVLWAPLTFHLQVKFSQ